MVQSLNLSGIVNVFRAIRNARLIMPHMVVDVESLDIIWLSDIRQIDFVKLKEQGVRVMAFDKDNCLTAPYVNHVPESFESSWKLCKDTFGHDRVIIVSNSAGTADDANHQQISCLKCLAIISSNVEKSLGVNVLRHTLKKPAGGQALLQRFENIAKPHQIAMVGDRLLTDVLFGNLNGTITILTRRIISDKGDNQMAAMIRRFEHRLLDALQSRRVQAPNVNEEQHD
ncbi:hypothetical protein INT43_007614 [Umbelopsis isabellina]|uniref:Mitochondrial PGP phosphatase n=1 Tax=Mortierella isabellina TaxID=91625 RepID=A0A8H7UBM7_MORIS|nr:hypothetical protein INT43_007614 [Umbelopsis isabellina]